MKQWLRGGANNAPHHASGTRATDRALSHTRSLTAAAGNKCTAPTDADGKAQTIYDVDPVEGQFKPEGLDWGTYTLEETKSPDGYDLIPPFVRSRSARSPTATAPATGIRTALLKAIRIRRALSQLPIRLTTLMCSTSRLGGLRTSRGWCCRRLAAKGI